MRGVVVTFCALIVAASAHKLLKDDAAIDADTNAVAKEAILVGMALRETARQLAEDEKLDSEINEYFIGAIFDKIKNAVGAVVATAGDILKGAGDKIGSFNAQEKVEDKVTKILTKVLEKSELAYSSNDAGTGPQFVKDVSKRLDNIGRRVVEQGREILGVYDVDF
uniref:Putative secreted protein n=1 Tax=Amblyomma triste TaxID=251400 RepID=A0A023GCG4_AMBTT